MAEGGEVDGDFQTQAQRAVGDAFQWRVLELEQAKRDHELRLREVERGVSTVTQQVDNVDSKIDAVLKKLDETTQGRLAQYSTAALTVLAVVLTAVLEHFWK